MLIVMAKISINGALGYSCPESSAADEIFPTV